MLDPWLYLLPIVLMGISVAVIYTLTINTSGPSVFEHQAIASVLGIILMVAVTFVDYRSFKSWSPWIYLLGLISLIAVTFIGKSDFGAQRWVNLGFFQFQPGELEKLVIIVVLAAFFSRPFPVLPWQRFLESLGILFIPTIIVMFQPDLGTAIVIVMTGIGIVLHSKISRSQLVSIILGVVLAVVVLGLSFHEVRPFNKLLKEYQKDRLVSFIDPSRDSSGSGYNVLQSVIAVGSGGLMGKGLGQGTQSQLDFLPVAQADFIFAGIAESWGFVGSLAILMIYAVLLGRMISAARIAKDDFGTLLVVGVIIKISIEMLVNIGMNIRVMPVTGIPLPFLSYGGTTMLTNAILIGMVQSIVIRYKRINF
jgi:rod shape determining protein RodA